jgi:hypothetical protein
MILELIIYEVSTTAASLLGLKALAGGGVKRQMLGLKQPKRLPVIDGYLKRQLGETTKLEEKLSRTAVKAVNHLSQYQAFRLILIMAGRKIKHEIGNQYHSAQCRGIHSVSNCQHYL